MYFILEKNKNIKTDKIAVLIREKHILAVSSSCFKSASNVVSREKASSFGSEDRDEGAFDESPFSARFKPSKSGSVDKTDERDAKKKRAIVRAIVLKALTCDAICTELSPSFVILLICLHRLYRLPYLK